MNIIYVYYVFLSFRKNVKGWCYSQNEPKLQVERRERRLCIMFKEGKMVIKQEKVQSLKDIKCFALDMDGTVYLGDKILPGVLDFLSYLRNTGRDFIFLTNNSSRDAAYYAKKLALLDLKNYKNSKKIFLVVTPALE
ncbi:MAG: HAD-superfamily hydrolase, subfamily [Pelosinus sp.]|nr:HAD-superfamily hydrolase, subfamily [Pelosinus sp.]